MSALVLASSSIPAAARHSVSVQTANDADAAAWDHFVSVQPDATGYHAWAWRAVFTGAFGHECIYLAARDGGRIVGVLPLVLIESAVFGRSLTSLPFLNYGGIAADAPDAVDALLAAAADVARARRCGHVELRHLRRQCPSLPFRQHKVRMTLKLGPGMWERLDGKVRNQIRKAQKSELTSESGGVELIPEFYGVFARNMRDLGTPVYGRRFFDEVMRAFPERARVHIVRLHGGTIAAALTFRTNGTVEVPWASSIRAYNQLCPNHQLYWGIIEEAVSAGSHTLDFGRSTPHEGTYKFKAQWGAQPTPMYWEYHLADGQLIPDATPANPKYRLAIAAWKKLPVPLANWLGPRIVRGIP